jgi:hypothetical protein
MQHTTIYSPQVLSKSTPTTHEIRHIFPQPALRAIIFGLLIVAAEASLNERWEERLTGHFFSSNY